MKNPYVAVEGFSNLVRDKRSNAILNVDKHAIEEARARKKMRLERKQEDENLKNKISKLESDMSEIKHALELLLKRSV